MKMCPHCGQPLDDNGHQCSNCDEATTEPKNNPVVTGEQVSKEKVLITIGLQLIRSKRFGMGVAYAVAGLLTVVWGIQAIGKLMEPKAEQVAVSTVDEQVVAQLDSIIDEVLQEKLAWGQEVMQRRLPIRFPEELILKDDRSRADIQYENDKQTALYYEFQIAYHMDNDPPETYRWRPVTIYFELRDNKWVRIGEQWLRAGELVFE